MKEKRSRTRLEVVRDEPDSEANMLAKGVALSHVLIEHLKKEAWPEDSASAIHAQRALDVGLDFEIRLPEALELACDAQRRLNRVYNPPRTPNDSAA